MKHFRIHMAVDIVAKNRAQAERRSTVIYSDIEATRRTWIGEILADGIEERIALDRGPR
jgi:hypothetical protein